jgi:hypothetical protein
VNRFKAFVVLCSLLVCSLVLSSCGGGGSSLSGPQPPPTPRVTPGPMLAVGNWSSTPTVTLYSLPLSPGSQPLQTISLPSSLQLSGTADAYQAPQGLTFGPDGTLYVVLSDAGQCPNNCQASAVMAYVPQGNRYPSSPTAQSAVTPDALQAAAATSTALYVTDYSSGQILTFPVPPIPGNWSGTQVMGGLNLPLGIGLAQQNLFIAISSGSVVLAAPPYSQATPVVNGISNPWAVALDAAGDLFVHYNPPTNPYYEINEYQAGTYALLGTITNGVTSPLPQDLAVDKAGNLYLATYGSVGDTVKIYAPPYSGNPTAFTNGVNKPGAVAIFP